MEKYKICPNCGTHNNPVFMQCTDCDEDLTSVRITDEQTENISQNIIGQPKIMIRICEDCGAENPSSARKCESCGEDISYIIPTEKAEQQQCEQSPEFVLATVDNTYEFKIEQDVHIIGRENDMSEYLSSKPYVSRIHAKLTVANNELYVTNMSGTNYTYVNNEKIPNDTPVKVSDGDEIGLGGMVKDNQRQDGAAYFIVRIR